MCIRDRIGREGIKEIESFVDMSMKKEKPFFLWYAPFMPHTPHTPPERLLKKYKAHGLAVPVAKYYAMCEWFDETCGDVMKMLEDRKIRETPLLSTSVITVGFRTLR